MKTASTLIDSFMKFNCIDPYQTCSWADMIIVCAANGLEPDIDLFQLLTIGSFLSKQVQKMFMHTLKETTLLDEMACKLQAVEIIYTTSCLMHKPTCTFHSSTKFESISQLEEAWYIIYPNQPDSDYIDPYQSASTYDAQEYSTKNYCMKLFKTIDLKFPMAWLKFYSANSRTVELNNMFMKFLLSTTRVKAKLNKQFQPLLALLEKDVSKHEAKAMHLV